MYQKLFITALTVSSLLITTTVSANPNVQNQRNLPNTRMGGVPNNIPRNTPVPTPPDFINFDKFNTPRQCSPAEVFMGKTSCYMCDADTPNIIVGSQDRNAQRARQAGGVYVLIANNSPYARDSYHNAWSFDTRSNAPATNNGLGRGFTGIGMGTGQASPSIVLHGYNLRGIDKMLAPINNRTKCETFRPKYSAAEAASRGDHSGFRGAPVLGIGGKVFSASIANTVMNPNGNKGQGVALGDGNSKGTVNQTGSGGGVGSMGYSHIATESFVCLEYYTNTNTSNAGGDHILAHPTASTKCQQPMQQFYQTYVSEYCPYLCDGDSNGIYRPLTIVVRYIYLLTNPFVMYGNTLQESLKIAQQRPDYQY